MVIMRVYKRMKDVLPDMVQQIDHRRIEVYCLKNGQVVAVDLKEDKVVANKYMEDYRMHGLW